MQQAGIRGGAFRVARDRCQAPRPRGHHGQRQRGLGRIQVYEFCARRQDHLPLVVDDAAGIGDVGRGQQHKTLRAAGDGGAILHHHIVVLAVGENAVDQERCSVRNGVDASTEKFAVAGGKVAAEKIQRTGDQRLRIHLAAGTEQDAVAIEQIDRAFGLDLTEDLTGHAAGIDDAVQHDPIVVGAVGLVAAALIEIERGIATDVEAVPGQDRFLRGLLDLYGHLPIGRGLRRRVGVLP